MLVHAHTLHQLHGPLPQRACDGQLVEAKGRRRRLKAGEHLNGGVNANGDGDRQRLTQLRGPLGHSPDVPRTGLEEDGQLIPALDAHTVDGHVGQPRVRVGGVAHPQSDVRPRVHWSVGGGRDQLEQVEVRGIRPVDYLLAWGGAIHYSGLDGVCGAGLHKAAQFLLFAAEQVGHPGPAGQHTDDHRCAGVALHVMEHHSGAIHSGGAHDGAARPHIAVHAGQLGGGIYLHLGLNKLARGLAQYLKGCTQI